MKKTKIFYWVSTGIITFMMLFSGYSYFGPQGIEGFHKMGFPDFFRIELGVAKILGALVLIIPFIPKFFKDIAYAGFAITFISASIAHLSNGDPVFNAIMPFVFLGILSLSYFSFNKLKA